MYRLIVDESVFEESASFPALDVDRIMDAIRGLAQDARPMGVKKLRGYAARYRIRCGRYRILYEINDCDKIVNVLVAGHLKDVYRNR